MADTYNLEKAKREIVSSAREPQKVEQLLRLLDEVHQEEINKYKGFVNGLEEKIKVLETPPLQHGIIIGPSPDHSGNFIIGVQGTRFEVEIAKDSRITPADLHEGQEVLLNKDYNIVKIRDFSYSRGESAEVLDILDDSRLHIKSGDEGIIVEATKELQRDIKEKKVGIGDRVRLDPKLGLAFEKILTSEVKELLLEEESDVTYDMIGGLDEAIKTIRDAIELPYLYRNLFEEHRLNRPKGILLYGPPGCGKTMIAKAIANSLSTNINSYLKAVKEAIALYRDIDVEDESATPQIVERFRNIWNNLPNQNKTSSSEKDSSLAQIDLNRIVNHLEEFLKNNNIDMGNLKTELERVDKMLNKEGAKSYFMNIKGPELLNKYVGETESSIRKAFAQARKKASYNTPVILFFDEIESMFRTRGMGISSDVESTIVPQFLSELDGVERLENIIIIGASNRHELIDPAILRPGRLDIKIKIDRPDQNAAKKIFTRYLTPEIPVHQDELKKYSNKEEAINMLIKKAVEAIYDDKSYLQVVSTSNKKELLDENKPLYFRDFISGAMIESIVSRTKKRAVKRIVEMIEKGEVIEKGINWKDDILPSIIDEYEENKEQFVAQKIRDFQDKVSAPGDLDIKIILSREEKTEGEKEKRHPYDSGIDVRSPGASE